MALKVGQRIDIYKIVANEEDYLSPCMQVIGNLRPGVIMGGGVTICAINEGSKKWECDFYMYSKEVKLVGCMVIKSIK